MWWGTFSRRYTCHNYLYLSICLCLSVCLSIYLSTYLPACLSVCQSVCLSLSFFLVWLAVWLSVWLSIRPSIRPSILPSIHLPTYLPTYSPTHLPTYPPTYLPTYLWLYSPFGGPSTISQFLNLYTVGMAPWTGNQPVARPLPTHRTTQTQNKRTQTSMLRVGFEPTIPVFERAKTVHPLDRAAIAIVTWSYRIM
jgi:hypothetical protein